MEALLTMFTARPYVVAFLLAFAVLAACERGPLRMLLWLISGTAIGWLSELCSVRTGLPFGHYVYHQEQFAGELWLGPVPLFASLSFAFMSYFGFSAARRLLAPAALAPADDGMRIALLAAVIGMWMDTVIDPLTLLGRYWFLGDLYHYDPPGPHFGVPIMNYFGWVLTIGTIVMVNQQLDRARRRMGVWGARGPVLPLEPLWGIGCCLGVFVFMLGVNVMLLVRSSAPAGTPLGSMLLSGVIFTSAFIVLVGVMIRRGLAAAETDSPICAPSRLVLPER